MDLSDRPQLVEFLKSHHLWLRRESGQHFLVDGTVIEKIIGAAELKQDDQILEIGPGVGTLTRALGQAVPDGLVLAIEKDYRLVELLRKEFKNRSNVKILHADALAFLAEFKNQKSEIKMTDQKAKLPTKMVANLPYNITGLILREFFDPNLQSLISNRLVLMLQQEVVDRLLAPPGSSARGILTILRELYGPATKVCDVPKTAFFPMPAVDSSVVRIDHVPPYDRQMCRTIVWLAKLGFAAKRRTIENVLAAGLREPKEAIRACLARTQIPAAARAEALTLTDWRALAAEFPA